MDIKNPKVDNQLISINMVTNLDQIHLFKWENDNLSQGRS